MILEPIHHARVNFNPNLKANRLVKEDGLKHWPLSQSTGFILESGSTLLDIKNTCFTD